MAETKSNGLLWLAGIGALAVVAIGIWLAASDSQEPAEPAPAVPALAKRAPKPAPSVVAPAVAAPELRIPENGRLILALDALPSDGPLALGLDLSEEARGIGDRTVRIISTDGRRLDTTARQLPGRDSGLRLEIDPSFLSAGRYLIEVDTEEKHALQLRRYVLELK